MGYRGYEAHEYSEHDRQVALLIQQLTSVEPNFKLSVDRGVLRLELPGCDPCDVGFFLDDVRDTIYQAARIEKPAKHAKQGHRIPDLERKYKHNGRRSPLLSVT